MVTKIQIAGKLKFYSKPYGRQWKWRYQTHGHTMQPQTQVPKTLRNIPIIDPLIKKQSEKVVPIKWQPSTRHPLLSQFFAAPRLNEHPLYQKNSIKLFDASCQLHAGLEQACLLTKTMPISGLPPNFTKFTDESNDLIVKDYLKQALAFTARKEVCERLKIPTDVKFMIAREYATPPKEQMRILLDNLIRLSNMNLLSNPTLLSTRTCLQDSPLTAYITRADTNLLIRRNSEFTILSKQALTPICNETLIETTRTHQLTDMYPIFPTVDLKNEHLYDSEELCTVGVRGESKFNNLHTLFHVNDDQVSAECNMARLLMFVFAGAVAQSKIMRKNDTLKLNADMSLVTPIVINGVSISNSHCLNLLSFQLNTLALNDNSGIKNICYHDMNNELYFNRPNVDVLPYPTHKNIQRMAMRQLEYNPDVFVKLQSVIGYN